MRKIRRDKVSGPQSGDEPEEVTSSPSRQFPVKGLRIFAVIVGLVGAILAILVPFLPVIQQATTLDWPTQQGTRPVSAPLTAQSPVALDATVPCQGVRDLDNRRDGPSTLFNTNPPNSDYGKLTNTALYVNNGLLTLTTRGQQLGTLPISGGDCTITVHSDSKRTTAKVGGETLANSPGDHRPQLTGIFSDLQSGADDTNGLSVSAKVDNRWDSSATVLKWTVIAVSMACFVAAIWALHRFDRLTQRRIPRLAPKGWWKLKFRDVVVLGVLVVWWLIGAMTADDGYFLTMARIRDVAGYIGEYYRWFGAAGSPMYWFIDIYSAMTKVSTLVPWMRLPSLLMGIACWFLLSRAVLPRLGQQVRRSNAAGWAAAAVFLAFWMPYNNGLRPENIVATLSLITLCAVERAVATRRLTPAAIGLVVAALSVAANPHGLMAVLPFVVAAKPLLRMVRQRAQQFGWLTVLAPIAACGFVVLNLIFYDQTLAGALDVTKLHRSIGPSQSWYQELARYDMLFTSGPDGSMTRRFPVLLVMLCLVTCAVVLLRRGIIRGAALGPSRRLLAMSALSFVVLAAAPTKHSHHFGMLASVGGGLAALTALATSTNVLQSRRNRAAFFAGLMFISALAAAGPNAWWYVSSWGVPWYNIPPQLFGISASSVLLGLALIALIVAGIEHMRLDEHKPFIPHTPADRSGIESRSRALRLGSAPLAIVCTLLMVFEIGSLGKAIDKRADTYNMGLDNVKQVAGQSCGLSDYVYVEQQPLDGILTPAATQPGDPAPGWKPPDNATSPDEDAASWLQPNQLGFQTDAGVPPESSPDPAQQKWKPPYQMGGPNAPTWGSFEPTGYGTGEMRTPWYSIPQRARDGDVPMVVAAAGQTGGSNAITAEFGKNTQNGFKVTERRLVTVEAESGWEDARLTVDGKAAEADQVRLVGEDKGLGSDAWVAFSAPRVPQLARMTDVVGDSPTFLEWTAALQHPCLRPSAISNGVAEMPRFRVSGGGDVRDIGQGWSSPDAGGPFGWINVATSMRELPTYLKGDVDRDWGSLYEVDPYVPDALPAEAAEHRKTVTHGGLSSPGPFAPPIHLPGNVPNSDNRGDLQNSKGQNDGDQS